MSSNLSSPAVIARSLTTRINRKKSVTDGVGGNGPLGRAFSLRRQEKTPVRPEISLPIELISATNPLAFNAPDLPLRGSPAAHPVSRPLNAVPSSNSLRSDGSVPALSSAASTTFTFSGISTPTDELAESQLQDLQNRLAASEAAAAAAGDAPSSPQSQKSFSSNKARSPLSETPAPAVPKRAPSHTKKTHQALARSRSISRAREVVDAIAAATAAETEDSKRESSSSSGHLSTGSAKDTSAARNSADMFSTRNHPASIDTTHPFGAELAQLTEVAEEFSPRRERADDSPRSHTRSASSTRLAMPPTPRTPGPIKAGRKQKHVIEPTVWDEEQDYLFKHGLRTFSAEEYMAEIGSPYELSFPTAVY